MNTPSCNTDAVGLVPRLLAGLIDLAIVLPLQILTGWLILATSVSGPIFVIPFIVNMGYYTLFWAKSEGATPGKKLVGLKVVDAQTGEPVQLAASRKRWLGMWGSLLLCGYGFARIASDPQHQALHDRWAKTKVVRAR